MKKTALIPLILLVLAILGLVIWAATSFLSKAPPEITAPSPVRQEATPPPPDSNEALLEDILGEALEDIKVLE